MGKEVSLFSDPCYSQSLNLFCCQMPVNLHIGQENPEGQFSLQDARRYISSILRFHFAPFLPNPPLFLSACRWVSVDPAKATAYFCHVEGLSLDPNSLIRSQCCP